MNDDNEGHTEMTRAEFAALLHRAVDDLVEGMPEQVTIRDAKLLDPPVSRGHWHPHEKWMQWLVGPLAEVWMRNEWYRPINT